MAKDNTVSVDENFLKDFAAAGGQAQTSGGTPINADNVDTFLSEYAAQGSAETTKQQKLHKQAKKADSADTTEEDRIAAEKEAARIQELQDEEDKKASGAALAAAKRGVRSVKENVAEPAIARAGDIAELIGNYNTAGGIAGLLTILVVLLLVVVVVNSSGDTRLKQFWYMLNGRASLQGRKEIQKGSSVDVVAGAVNGTTPGAGAANSSGFNPDLLLSLYDTGYRTITI